MEQLKEQVMSYVKGIQPTDKQAMKKAQEESMNLLKIPMSLGRVEEVGFKLASITGKTVNDYGKKCIIIMSADNGIVAKGVSSAPQSVTKTMTECFSKYVTGVGVVSKAYGNDLIVYDIGNVADIEDKAVINKKLMHGTNDFSEGPAMDYETALKAILVGIEAVKSAIEQGYKVIGTGEMGIGNTSSSTAVICALSGMDVAQAVGKGTGMTDNEAYQNKINLIKKGIEINHPDRNDPTDVLAKVGGLDIAALVGIYIGCAYYKVPVVIDGFISSAAFYAAYKLNPLVKEYAFTSHKTVEPGYSVIVKETGIKPMFDMDMRLGEGSGCPFTFFTMDAAQSMFKNMYTFEQGMCSTEYTDKLNDLQF